MYPTTPDTPGVRRSTRVKFKPGCPHRTGRVLSEHEIKQGDFLLGNFRLMEPTTGIILYIKPNYTFRHTIYNL